jgi:type II secretory pathway component PulF
MSPAKQRASAYTSLATMIEAGVPLERSLELASGSARGAFARALKAVSAGVAAGQSMSETMEAHPRAFAPLDRTLVTAGEHSGHLPLCLRNLADWHGFRDHQQRQLMSNMLLPLLVLHAAAVLAPLPRLFLTGMTGAQYGMQVFGILMVPYIIAAVVIVIYSMPNSGPARRVLDHVAIRIPLLGRALRQLALSRYFLVFSVLNDAGFSAIESTKLAANVGGNSVALDLLRGGTESSRQGRRISEGFSRRLDAEYLAQWQVGEETGMLSETTRRLSHQAAERGQMLIADLLKMTPRIVYLIIVIYLAYMIVQAVKTIYAPIQELMY